MIFLYRYGIATLAFIGWIFYQKKFKKKSWTDLKNDIIVILLFIGIASALYYWLLN